MEEGDFVHYGHFSDKEEEGVSNADVRTVCYANIRFVENYDVPAQKRRLRQCEHLADKGEGGSIFIELQSNLITLSNYKFITIKF